MNQSTNPQKDQKPLTGLERELLSYVERLVTASEASAAQFIALEKRSTGLITSRQLEIEDCLGSLIVSQTSLAKALASFASVFPVSIRMDHALKQSNEALISAEKNLPKKS